MKRNIGVVAALCGVILLAGCAGGQLSRAEKAVADGSEFSQRLYDGYLNLARSEYNEGDYQDSDAFARRARFSAKGSAVAPEEIAARRLPAEHVGELSDARVRLVSALDAGVAAKDPANAAKAQVMFDCWMQEQEEDWQPEDIAACRNGYLAAMEGLAPLLAAAPAPLPAKYVVYFGSNKADLDRAALAVIAEAKAAASKLAGATVRVSGNTDRDGDAQYNQMLSEMRADAVAKVLAAPENPVKAVVTEANGELQPAVMTDDGVPMRQNRRVEILIEP